MDKLKNSSNAANIIITLVKPQMGENIGMVARSMANFGLSTLRLVNPRDGWPNKKAWPASAGATTLLDNVKCYKSLKQACDDCHYVLATSARYKRKLKLNFISIDDAVNNIFNSINKTTNIIFGCEQSGLDNESLSLCHDTITFNTELNFPSLNLSHAVLLIAYELSKKSILQHSSTVSNTMNNAIARHSEVNRLNETLVSALKHANYFRSENKTPIQKQQIFNLLLKYSFQSKDVDAILGMIKSLSRNK